MKRHALWQNGLKRSGDSSCISTLQDVNYCQENIRYVIGEFSRD